MLLKKLTDQKYYLIFAFPERRKHMKKIIVLMLFASFVGACGIKPSNVDPPEEVQSGEFPRTYPNVNTDPPPYVRP